MNKNLQEKPRIQNETRRFCIRVGGKIPVRHLIIVTFTYTTLMPFSESPEQSPSDKHSYITREDANYRFYF